MNDPLEILRGAVSLLSLHVLPLVGIAVAWASRVPARFALVRAGITWAIPGAIVMMFTVWFLQNAPDELPGYLPFHPWWFPANIGLGTVFWGGTLGLLATALRGLIRRVCSMFHPSPTA